MPTMVACRKPEGNENQARDSEEYQLELWRRGELFVVRILLSWYQASLCMFFNFEPARAGRRSVFLTLVFFDHVRV
jgi:hypothetical protein